MASASCGCSEPIGDNVRIGVFGATGQVGGVMRDLLLERNFPIDEIRFFASARSAGKTIEFGDKQVTVEDTGAVDAMGRL